ncbi:MAG: permease-like cell division protein FtsX [Chromatiales bacterium]
MSNSARSRTTAHRRAGFAALPGAWLRAHRRALTVVLSHLARAPLAHLLTAAVMGIALALPLGLYVLLDNIELVSGHWAPHGQRISLFLKTGVDDADAAVLANRLATQAGIGNVQVITREQALEEYRNQSGVGDALTLLGENPLPTVLLVEPVAGIDARVLTEELGRITEVEAVRFDFEWLQRLQAITAVARRAVAVVAAIFAAAVLLVVGHAIRMAVAQRREEIEIVKLFGATDAFVRRPFLYTGLLYGVVGALLASAVVTLALAAIAEPVAGLALLYQSDYALRGLTWRSVFAVALASGGFSVAAAWWTAGHHIRGIEVK